jgi:hypothetical protein
VSARVCRHDLVGRPRSALTDTAIYLGHDKCLKLEASAERTSNESDLRVRVIRHSVMVPLQTLDCGRNQEVIRALRTTSYDNSVVPRRRCTVPICICQNKSGGRNKKCQLYRLACMHVYTLECEQLPHR